jgi:two-component system response regulator YesN
MLSNRISIGKEMLLIDHGVRLEADDEAAAIGRADEKMIHMLLHQKKMDALELYLEAGEKKKYFKELSELVDPLKNIDGKSNATAVLAYYKITLSLLSYIHRSNLFDKLSVYIEKNKLMQIDSNKSWAEAVDDIFNISDEIFNHQYEEEKSREDNTITYIHRFVESHLNEDLSLIRLAEQVYLNPSYLSRFYKLSTGINLSHYIDSVRIEKAKQLLKSENLKIYKVAKAVGYETPASFTRFFKKIVGISPQEYLDSAKAANKEIAQTI